VIKADLVARIADECGTTQVAAEKWVNAIFNIVGEVLAEGQDIVIVGFGKFRILPTPEKKSKNPITGEMVVTPAGYRVKFVPADRIKKGLNHIGFVSFD